MSHVLYRNFSIEPPQAVRGDGSRIWDKSGKSYLDLSGGAFVNCLGHGRKDLIQRIADRMKSVSYVNGWHFSSPQMEEYSDRILKYAPKGFSRVGLLSSGSEGVEASLKLVRQSFVESGKSSKIKIIARSPSYHGNTGLALSASARRSYKKYFSDYLCEVSFVSAPQEYRKLSIDFATELEKKILELGPENVATFILEPIMGSSGAASAPPEGYLKAIQEVCLKYDVKIVADEVACGAGRCGHYLVSTANSFSPDVIVLGKGVNAGIIPTSVVMVRDNIIDAIQQSSGSFMHHQTYMHSPMMAACALEVLNEIEREGLVERVQSEGKYFGSLLKEELEALPHVGAVTGQGFFWGITIVRSKSDKSWFPPEEKTVLKLFKKLLEAGLILWPVSGDQEALQNDCFMIAPPYTLSRDEMAEGLRGLKSVLNFNASSS